jgi:hypothetical protein
MADNNIIKENATEELTNNIWKTYRSMFNAHNRLMSIYKLQKFSTIAVAIYILCISIIILNDHYFSPEKINLYNIYLIILSIISLTLSLTIGESGNKELAEKFQLCARKLQILHNRIILNIEQKKDFKLTDKYIKEYERIFKKFNFRQDPIDYEYLKYEKYKRNNICYLFVILFHIKYFLFTKFVYILLLILPLLGVAIIQFIKI